MQNTPAGPIQPIIIFAKFLILNSLEWKNTIISKICLCLDPWQFKNGLTGWNDPSNSIKRIGFVSFFYAVKCTSTLILIKCRLLLGTIFSKVILVASETIKHCVLSQFCSVYKLWYLIAHKYIKILNSANTKSGKPKTVENLCNKITGSNIQLFNI